jgi:hypothetical protein
VVSGSRRDERREQGSAQGDAGLQVQLIGTSPHISAKKPRRKPGLFVDSNYRKLFGARWNSMGRPREKVEPYVIQRTPRVTAAQRKVPFVVTLQHHPAIQFMKQQTSQVPDRRDEQTI